MVADIDPHVGWPGAPNLGWSSSPAWLTAAGGRLYFTAITQDAGRELWTSDGTASGTVRLADVNPGTADAFLPDPGYPDSVGTPIFAVGSSAFFVAEDGVVGRELWETGGTPQTTLRVADVFPGATSSYPRPMSVIRPAGSSNPSLVFSAADPIYGRELWKIPADSVPPVVTSAVVAGGPPFTLRVGFSEDVSASLSVADLTFSSAANPPDPPQIDYPSRSVLRAGSDRIQLRFAPESAGRAALR